LIVVSHMNRLGYKLLNAQTKMGDYATFSTCIGLTVLGGIMLAFYTPYKRWIGDPLVYTFSVPPGYDIKKHGNPLNIKNYDVEKVLQQELDKIKQDK